MSALLLFNQLRMTKEQIKEAITQGYKHLGVPEPVIDGLTALGLTVVKDESEIAAFVQGEAVKGVMRTFQSESDKVRTEYSTKLKTLETEKAELEAKLNGNQPNPEPIPEPTAQPDFKAMLAEAVAELVNPLKEEIATMKSRQAAENAVNTTKDYLYKWDWANGFPELRDETWEEVMERYEESGSKWTVDELKAKTTAIFNRKVAKKGVTDTTQPFKSDGGAGGSEEESNKAFADEIRNALGLGKE